MRSRTLLLSTVVLAVPAWSQTTAPTTVVTATRIPTELANLGSAVTVITRADIERHQDRLVEDALRRVPGLAVSRTGPLGGVTQVRLRGTEGNHTLVLIDGIEVSSPVNGNEFDFSTLLAADVERIEVLRGPQSVLYGSDAVGGVIAITTRRGADQPALFGRVEAGSRGTINGTAGAAGRTGAFSYGLSTGYYHTDGVSALAPRLGGVEDDAYTNKTASGTVRYAATGDLAFGATLRAARTDAEFDDVFGAMDTDDASTTDQLFGRTEAVWETLGDRLTNKFGVAYGETDYESNSGYRSEGTRTTFDYEGLTDLTPTAELVFGLETERETFKAVGDTPDAANRTNGAYASVQFDPTVALSLSAGARYTDHSAFGSHLNYRLAGAYFLDVTDTKLHASYGTAFKAPTYFEQFGFPPFVVANPDLGPETSRGWDIGVEQWFLDESVRIDLAYFDNDIEDLIEYDPSSPARYINAGRAETRGVELSVGADIGRAFVEASATWTEAVDPLTGDQRVRVPEFQAAATLVYDVSEQFEAVAEITHVGERPDLGGVRLDSYTLVQIGGSYRVNERIEVFGRIENLFDEDYEEVFGYGAPGRGFFVGASVRF